MTVSSPEGSSVVPRDVRCAGEIRVRALIGYGSGQPPSQVLLDTAEEIRACCGHSHLKSTRLAWGWSGPAAVTRLSAVAEAADLPERGTDERTWRRWESGHLPDADYQDRLARLFETGPVQLGFATDYTHPSGGDRTNRRNALRLGAAALMAPVLSAESEARELTRRSEQTDLGPSGLDHLRQTIAGYGHNYSQHSADVLWHAALGDRRHVAELLQMRMTLKQRRELYVAAAWLSLILAWSAHDRGDTRAALAYAADARHHAGEAEHDEAAAWAWDVEATTWLYDDRPEEALRAAQRGIGLAPVGSAAQTRLTGQVARTHARLGHAASASDALMTLRGMADRHASHEMGLFSADVVRVWSVTATSSLWLGDDEQARRYAEQALVAYEQHPQVSPTRLAITALDLGMACARLGDPEQAVAHGLKAISTPRYAAAIVSRSVGLGVSLERAYPHAAVVAQLRQGVAELGKGSWS
ncbi:hypothetical protein [Streptosporangium subroseum]|uniref:hypothetical protein n=1 Tax=Streptosporangium subroseum TaxID=106412 RepID=UPI00308BF09F|nr:hypothetical protein OHB15_02035 [Streptosporangium subroseum]